MSTWLRAGVAVAVLLAVGAGTGRAQPPGGAPQVATQGGQPLPAATGILATAVREPFMGGVPVGAPTGTVLPLSLADALARGLRQNLGLLLSEQAQKSASGLRWQALSGLLPSAALRIGQAREQINLEEFGFPTAPGQSPIIGPFNVSSVRVGASGSIFDWAAIERARAGGEMENAAGLAFKDAREMVVFVTSSLYLQTVTGAARIDAARALLKTAQALYDRAVSLKQAGVVAGIEVLRAQVQLQAEQQRVIFVENEFAKQKLVLERAIGIPLGQSIQLTDRMAYLALPETTVEDALAEATRSRLDLRGALALLKAAELNRQSAIGEALPSVTLSAEYGKSSDAWDTLKGTYAVIGAVRVPIFQGGRVKGRVLQADAQLAQQRAQVEDLKAKIELEVRSSLLDVQAADQRVRVARGAADLANEQLAQAQDRFSAGVTGNIEVVQAQEAAATAAENYLSALFAHNLAKIAVARAIGLSEARAQQYLGGTK
jgi:outer membrane protein TolC